MVYFFTEMLSAAVCPSSVFLLLVLAACPFLMVGTTARWGLGLLIAGVVGLAACAFTPVGTWLLRPLEDRFPPMNAIGEPVDGIVLLGGAIDLPTSLDRGMPALNSRAERIVTFVALARRYPSAQLLVTGGNPDLFMTRGTEADVTRVLIEELGLSPRRVTFERSSRNTHEIALFSKRLVHLKPGQRWLLITSAADMPRAVGCFRAIGWPVIPVPVDYHTQQNSAGWAPGLLKGLEKANWATHEWIGLLYYRLRGWTGSLFPGPET